MVYCRTHVCKLLNSFLYCRRKHRQVTGYNGDDDSDRDIYHAYNFSFQNKYDKN